MTAEQIKLSFSMSRIYYAVGTLFVLGSILAATWTWATNTFVQVKDFTELKQHIFAQEIKVLEDRIFELNVKQEVYPSKFDAVDKAVLQRSKESLASKNGKS